ncbi:hypothetical protein EVAR_50247_1 [Eumeta japonica]|uniref:Uncharacterized protein n=1 Tax=Eumeta variegata TaxID=151549 RepID=A0A4C1YL19_EUMVA|nr:hypothetical protein EVAR_50247_1 [Eumeta japonica]
MNHTAFQKRTLKALRRPKKNGERTKLTLSQWRGYEIAQYKPTARAPAPTPAPRRPLPRRRPRPPRSDVPFIIA